MHTNSNFAGDRKGDDMEAGPELGPGESGGREMDGMEGFRSSVSSGIRPSSFAGSEEALFSSEGCLASFEVCGTSMDLEALPLP